jgi:soluble cytochrome b562
MVRSSSKLRKLIAAGSLALLVATPALYADEESHRPPTTQQSAQQRKVDLEHEMETMGKSLKTLQKQITDSSKNASSLAILQQMQAATLAAKSVIPGRVNRLAEPQRAEKLKDYRSMLLNVLSLELEVEENLLDNNNTEAAKTLEEIKDLQKQGHDEFEVKEHHH